MLEHYQSSLLGGKMNGGFSIPPRMGAEPELSAEQMACSYRIGGWILDWQAVVAAWSGLADMSRPDGPW